MACHLKTCTVRRRDVDFAANRSFLGAFRLFNLKSSMWIYLEVLIKCHVSPRGRVIVQLLAVAKHIRMEPNLWCRHVIICSVTLRNIEVRFNWVRDRFFVLYESFTGWFGLMAGDYGHLSLSRLGKNGLNSRGQHSMILNRSIFVLRDHMNRLAAKADFLSLQVCPIGIRVGPVGCKVIGIKVWL